MNGYITPDQRKMLEGLQYVNLAYVSASEHNVALDLCTRGLAHAWTSQHGATMWKITDAGRAAITPRDGGQEDGNG